MRKLALSLLIIATAAIAFVSTATPEAAADAGKIEEHIHVVIPRPNPCTGEITDVTYDIYAVVHTGHPNNFVVNLDYNWSTADGYEASTSGVYVFNKNGEHETVTIMMDNGEGSRFRINTGFRVDRDGVVHDLLRMSCIS